MAATKNISLLVLLGIVVLFVASCAGMPRGSAEHQRRQLRPTRGFKEMELSAARNFGKRAVPINIVNRILMEWLAHETKMKNLREDHGNVNMPVSLESVRNALRIAELQDDNSPGDGVLLEE